MYSEGLGSRSVACGKRCTGFPLNPACDGCALQPWRCGVSAWHFSHDEREMFFHTLKILPPWAAITAPVTARMTVETYPTLIYLRSSQISTATLARALPQR